MKTVYRTDLTLQTETKESTLFRNGAELDFRIILFIARLMHRAQPNDREQRQ